MSADPKKLVSEWIELVEPTEFNDIPNEPEGSNFWMLNDSIALWFSTFDKKWRFMSLPPLELVRRSGETFETKEEAKAFLEAGKNPTWMKGGIV